MAASSQPTLRFDPLPAQQQFMESTAPELVYSGAFGAGKTRVGCEKGAFLSYKYPGNVGLVCRKQFSDLKSTTLQTLLPASHGGSDEDTVIPEHHIDTHHKTDNYIDIQTGTGQTSRIWYRGLDRARGIGSMNLGWVFVDEGIELEEGDWSMLEGRLRLASVPFHQLFSATNPAHPGHWMYLRFYKALQEDPELAAVREVVEADAFQNPHNPDTYRERLDRFTGTHRERYVLGKWVGHEGLVYPEYDPRKHLVESVEVSKNWPRWRAVDWGTANPFVCQWWTQDLRDGTLILYQEIYQTGRTAQDHARLVQRHTDRPVQWTVADHDPGDAEVFRRSGITTRPAIKDIQLGIQLVRDGDTETPGLAPREIPVELDQVEEYPGAYVEDGVVKRPGILFVQDAVLETDPRLEQEGKPTCTHGEVGSYQWAEGTRDRVKDVPLKKNDHGMDAMRYFVTMLEQEGQDPSNDFDLGDYL